MNQKSKLVWLVVVSFIIVAFTLAQFASAQPVVKTSTINIISHVTIDNVSITKFRDVSDNTTCFLAKGPGGGHDVFTVALNCK